MAVLPAFARLAIKVMAVVGEASGARVRVLRVGIETTAYMALDGITAVLVEEVTLKAAPIERPWGEAEMRVLAALVDDRLRDDCAVMVHEGTIVALAVTEVYRRGVMEAVKAAAALTATVGALSRAKVKVVDVRDAARTMHGTPMSMSVTVAGLAMGSQMKMSPIFRL